MKCAVHRKQLLILCCPRYAFFLEVILKFIDMVPEQTRDVKYAEELHGLQKKVLDALKKDDPDYVPLLQILPWQLQVWAASESGHFCGGTAL